MVFRLLRRLQNIDLWTKGQGQIYLESVLRFVTQIPFVILTEVFPSLYNVC